MKFFLISDNIDTKMGLRLSGIDGVVVHEREETEAALKKAVNDPDVAVILMTGKLFELCRDSVLQYKLNKSIPLIAQIPDRHANTNVTAPIVDYVQSAIGIRIE